MEHGLDVVEEVDGNKRQHPLRNGLEYDVFYCMIQSDVWSFILVFSPSNDLPFHGTEYRLWVTDPAFERNYLAKPDGMYKIGECFLTISLGEAFDDASYKLIAAIFDRESGDLS